MVEDNLTGLDVFSHTVSELGEGPLFYEGVFYWVDLVKGTLISRDRNGEETVLFENRENVPTSIVPSRDGNFYLTCADGFYKLSTSGELLEIPGFKVTDPMIRFNDGKCDGAGNFWAGTMDKSETNPKGALYVLNSEKNLSQVLTGVTVSNGLCWSEDQSILYYVDSPTKRICAFDLDVNSLSLSNRRSIFKIEDKEVFPDGMCIDLNGNIWVALWGGYGVVCVDPMTGSILDKVDVPCARVTSCCFGGSSYDELIITTASVGMSDEDWQAYPDSGKVFRARPGVIGLPADTFGE